MGLQRSAKGQIMPDGVEAFDADAFKLIDETHIRWLGGAGILINTRGTNVMIDPVLDKEGMPSLFSPPISLKQVPKLDTVLITHIDCDHYSVKTCRELTSVCKEFHSTKYVALEMRKEKMNGIGHFIGEQFNVDDAKVTLTKTVHNWQNEFEEYNYRQWQVEDYCGFFVETLDGNIWVPGDSKLIEEHLKLEKTPDVILMDFSDDSWHIGLEGAKKLANTYPLAKIICIHWGTIDDPNGLPFNADPRLFVEGVINNERVSVLNPGEVFVLKK